VKPLRLAFAGTPDFAARHLEALLDTPHRLLAVLTQPDRPAGRGKQARPGPVKTLAESRGLPVLQPATLRDSEVQGALRALDLDALVVVAYGLILPQPVLDIPRFGCINVHGSLLPRWRGAAPIQRAIEAGDDISGVTIMQMDAGLDTGPMLAKATCAITPLSTSADLYARLAELGPTLLRQVLQDLPAAIAAGEAQDDHAASYAAKIDKNEAQLDWQLPAPELARRVRAFNPAPGCYSFLGGERIKIWEAQPQPGGGGTPGEIIDCEAQGVLVACAEGALRLTRLQFPGARALPVADLLRGRGEQLRPGLHFQQRSENTIP
jgi:methionyl-tRNA formyltransferase